MGDAEDEESSEKKEKHSDEDIMNAMQRALESENDQVVGRPPFHLRSGDLIVWTDIRWKPNPNQIEKKKELEVEASKKRRKLEKNPKFKGSKKDTFLSKMRREPQSLKIRTYEEFMEDERRKKEKEKEEEKKKENNNDDDDDKEEKKQLFNSMVVEDSNKTKQRGRSGSF